MDNEDVFGDDEAPGDDAEAHAPWEDDALEAVQAALARATWVGRKLRFELDDERRVVASRDEALDVLVDVYCTAWSGAVPFDGGAPVFEPDEQVAIDALDEWLASQGRDDF